ncbi:MAG: DUF11 domain-containing protein [candidate division Zixibacteria bacterium]|nr:DUF11 domain-containing protein [candidate division Zixibacteria bacterium]
MKTMWQTLLAIIIPILLLSLAFITPVTQAQYSKEIIMMSGQDAPGTDGAVFTLTSWNLPVICGLSDDGKVLFTAMLEVGVGDATVDNDMGLWMHDGDSTILLAREGSPVPSIPGQFFLKDWQFLEEDDVFLTPAGEIGLLAKYSSDGEFSDVRHGFFVEEDGVLEWFVGTGDVVLPGITATTIDALAFNNGRVLFTAYLDGDGVGNHNNSALCIADFGGITVVARKRDPLPELSPDFFIKDTWTADALSPDGRVIFRVIAQNYPDRDNMYVFYSWNPAGGYEILYNAGFIPYGTPQYYYYASSVRMNSDGHFARMGPDLDLDFVAIWTHGPNPEATIVVIDSGHVADGTGGATFTEFVNYVLYDNNDIALLARTSDDKLGIWIGDDYGLHNVAYIGGPAPGVEDGMEFYRVNNMTVNRNGQVAFSDIAFNPANYHEVVGIWASNADGLDLVAVSGEKIEVAPGDTRTFSTYLFGAGAYVQNRTGADGIASALNSKGELAFTVDFIEGGNALMVAYQGLVVNSIGDAPDDDLTDGRCDTGDTLSNGETECTLRAAIAEANAQEGYDEITFNIDEDPIISPFSSLPDIKDSVLINGFTQPGDLLPLLNGAVADVDSDGLSLRGQDITIQGIDIGSFYGNGISIVGADGITVGNNRIYGCAIGWFSSGGANYGNGVNGILIEGSSGNIIGGTDGWQQNVICSNAEDGIAIASTSKHNHIENNFIGLSPSAMAHGNSWSGVGIYSYSDSNFVGSYNGGNEIRGNGTDGIMIQLSNYNVIEGNIIGNNKSDGIEVAVGASHNHIIRNYIGVGKSSNFDGNLEFGINFVDDADSNFVGGWAESRNFISNNRKGGIKSEFSDFNIISGNYIGAGVSGLNKIGNSGNGILLEDCKGTLIGQYWSNEAKGIMGAGNVIGDNDSAGVKIISKTTGSSDNIIASNLIGLGADSISIIPNYWGVFIFSSSNNHIGGDNLLAPQMGNLIYGNTTSGVEFYTASHNSVSFNTIQGNEHNGIFLLMSSENVIEGNTIGHNQLNGLRLETASHENIIIGNKIGLDADNEPDGNNEYGIHIYDQSLSNIVGGTVDSGNVVSSNLFGGIKVDHADDNKICGNYVGTDPTGMLARGNQGVGVLISSSEKNRIGASDDMHAFEGAGNVISGNELAGVMVISEGEDWRCFNNTISSNLIGVGLDTTTVIPNKWGIVIFDAPRTLIGDSITSSIGMGNRIMGNSGTGIRLESDSCYVGSNWIEHNGYGPKSSGNLDCDGISVNGFDNTISTSKLWPMQIIRNNGGVGVRVLDNDQYENRYNLIRYNIISENVLGGIDLDPPGPNPNDDLDVDDGPNERQNAPELLLAFETPENDLVVTGNIKSEAYQWYQLDLYGSDKCDPSGFGQGETYLISDSVYTNGLGEATIEITDNLFTGNQSVITMTATDFLNNTSEFSNCIPIISSGIDLRIAKTDLVDTVLLQDTINYTISVINSGPDIASNVIVTDTLPGFVSYLADTVSHGSSTIIDSIFTCTVGDLIPGVVATMKIAARVDSAGEVINYAAVSTSGVESFLLNNIDVDTTISIDSQTDIENNTENELPDNFKLSQNHPNPFNATTNIGFSIPRRSFVKLNIYNLLGQKIETLINREMQAGYYNLNWNGDDVASGLYFYRIEFGNFSETKKMILLK